MEKRILGKSQIEVSILGLGSLTMGKLQKGSDSHTVESVVKACVERGINFVDGAELYGSYNILREFVKRDGSAVIASKSYAFDVAGAEKAFFESLKEIGRDYIDIFLMHEQESEHTIRGHHEALDFYLKMKKEGYVRAVGLSTHKIECVKAVLKFPEIDIVHPLFNYKGLGMFDGTLTDMENAVKALTANGVGVYAMKIFGGGHLLGEREKAVSYFLDKPYVSSAVIGMQTVDEVNFNADLFEGKDVSKKNVSIQSKKVQVEPWCEKCLKCIAACPQSAMSFVDNKVVIDHSRCVLCGYCGAACDNLCIKLF